MALQLLYIVLAFSTNSFHLLLSWARVFQFGTFIFCISFLTSSPAACLWSSCWPSWYGFPGVNCLYHSRTLHPFNVTEPAQSLCSVEFCYVITFYYSYFIQLLVSFIRHMPFSLFGPNIFLKIFLSNTNSLLILNSFNIHVSHEYVTVGLITEEYNFNFAIFYMSALEHLFICKLDLISWALIYGEYKSS